MNVELPYFTLLLEKLDAGDRDFLEAFGRHVHWGWWDRPEEADGSVEDFAAATERMCRRVCDAARIRAGDRVLDAGCGFGGTIASLDQRIAPLHLTGLNIDPRQLERARRTVRARDGNRIDFVEGDACALPFADRAFDAVLAVECIFHFPSRLDFLREAKRVLRPGGRLALTDFVATGKAPGVIDPQLAASVERFYGPGSVVALADYHALAEQAGMVVADTGDLTPGMLPTWPFARRLLARLSEDAARATALLEQQAREDVVHYLIVVLET